MKNVRLEEFNMTSFQKAGFDKAICAFGSCECHGGHLPFGIDTFVSHHLAVAVAERIDRTVVVPPLWYGMSLHYRHKPMCISLTSETSTKVIRDVFESLFYWGIERVFVINGHDGNIPCIESAARDVKIDHPEMRIGVLDAWWYTIGDLLPRGTFEVWNGLGHGGEGETSISLAVVPDLVDMSAAKGMIPALDPRVKLIWNFEELTDYGATGAPEKASAEKGEKMKKAIVDLVVDFIRKMDSVDWQIQKR
jgi:creatinine amidohydrolase